MAVLAEKAEEFRRSFDGWMRSRNWPNSELASNVARLSHRILANVDQVEGEWINLVPWADRKQLTKVIVVQKSENGPKTAAIDLDGTILEYDGWHGEDNFGKVRPGCVEALSELKRQGWRIIIFTTRGNTEKVAQYLEANGVPFDHVNENPDQPEGSSGKVIADVYVDDRAINAETDWSTILRNVLGRTYKAKSKKTITKKKGPFKFQSTQIDLPGDLSVAARRWVSGHIPEEALVKVEDDSHLTVRYGIKEHTNGR
jgi:hypothetical protein